MTEDDKKFNILNEKTPDLPMPVNPVEIPGTEGVFGGIEEDRQADELIASLDNMADNPLNMREPALEVTNPGDGMQIENLAAPQPTGPIFDKTDFKTWAEWLGRSFRVRKIQNSVTNPDDENFSVLDNQEYFYREFQCVVVLMNSIKKAEDDINNKAEEDLKKKS